MILREVLEGCILYVGGMLLAREQTWKIIFSPNGCNSISEPVCSSRALQLLGREVESISHPLELGLAFMAALTNGAQQR